MVKFIRGSGPEQHKVRQSLPSSRSEIFNFGFPHGPDQDNPKIL